MKIWKMLVSTTMAMVLTATPVLAATGQWMQNDYGYWWQRTDGSYPAAEWKWIDGNGDGIAECYHFDNAGYLDMDTWVEGYYVDEDGAWADNGVKYMKTTGVEETCEVGPASASAGAADAQTFPPIDYALEGNYEMRTELVDSLIHIENGRDGQPHLYFQMFGFHEDGSSAERLIDFLLRDDGLGQSGTVHHYFGLEANGNGAWISFEWMNGMDRLDNVVLNGMYMTSYDRQAN